MFTSFAFPLEGFRFLYIWGSKLQSKVFVCNITFVILTIFDFTILFGEEKISWLPSINKMTYENWRVTLFSTLKKISWITLKLLTGLKKTLANTIPIHSYFSEDFLSVNLPEFQTEFRSWLDQIFPVFSIILLSYVLGLEPVFFPRPHPLTFLLRP